MKTQDIKETILKNSEEVLRLHAAVHETCRHRDESPEARRAWTKAAAELSNRFDKLAFPDGYEGALDRLLNGDELAMESAICFLELRPYFYHSGFMFKDLLRKSRKAPLTSDQKTRLEAIEAAVIEWRNQKFSRLGKPSANSHPSRSISNE